MGKFCIKCGAPVDTTTDMCFKCALACGKVNFCSKCGTPIDKSMKICPACAETCNQEKEQNKQNKKQAWNTAKVKYRNAKKEQRKTQKKKWAIRIVSKICCAILLLALVGGWGYFALTKLGIISTEKPVSSHSVQPTSTPDSNESESGNGSMGTYNPPSGSMPNEYEPPRIDADEFFRQNSEIIEEIDANTAGCTEAETYRNLTERGFVTNPITTEYAMDGTYSREKEITSDGTDKHPAYTTMYITEEGNIWSIFEINGSVYANPVTYNYEHGNGVQVIISESETITSYDSVSNKFYVTKPAAQALEIKLVDRIDVATLQTLTIEEIGA